MIDRWQVQNDFRQAGRVARYHCWPTIQRQSVAEHTWQMLRIYYQIWGPPPEDVTVQILCHDVGELHIGDVPFQSKAKSKVLHAELDRLEREAVELLAGPIDATSPKFQRRIKICDILEMWEFGHTEELLGNKFAHPITADTILALNKLLTDDAPEEVAIVNKYMAKRKEFFKCT